jgi:CheY-like chemotaxis protein
VLLPKVFDLFVRAEGPRQEGGHRGMGVGLALVKKLVELHGGRVEARSEGSGKGSEFVVYLPAHAERGAIEVPRTDQPSHGAHPMRVLVVDDNKDAADSLTLLLGISGHEARAAYAGPQALALARELSPDVILLDLGMPGMDGYEVAREIRREPALRGITLIALTGWGQEEDRKRSAEAGFDRHMTKPVALDAVQRVFAEIAQGR